MSIPAKPVTESLTSERRAESRPPWGRRAASRRGLSGAFGTADLGCTGGTCGRQLFFGQQFLHVPGAFLFVAADVFEDHADADVLIAAQAQGFGVEIHVLLFDRQRVFQHFVQRGGLLHFAAFHSGHAAQIDDQVADDVGVAQGFLAVLPEDVGVDFTPFAGDHEAELRVLNHPGPFPTKNLVEFVEHLGFVHLFGPSICQSFCADGTYVVRLA